MYKYNKKLFVKKAVFGFTLFVYFVIIMAEISKLRDFFRLWLVVIKVKT